MTTQLPAAVSGQFFIGADLPVNRLGYGAMRITGEGIWGEPTVLKQARATLTRARWPAPIQRSRKLPGGWALRTGSLPWRGC